MGVTETGLELEDIAFRDIAIQTVEEFGNRFECIDCFEQLGVLFDVQPVVATRLYHDVSVLDELANLLGDIREDGK
jgi:hypothetical protein